MDFSHLSFVHEATLGGSTAIAQSKPQTSGRAGFAPARGLGDCNPTRRRSIQREEPQQLRRPFAAHLHPER